MEIKYTKHFLNRLEDVFSETDYILRYEKGNFQSGYCILKETKIAIVNKYYSLDGKINSLLEILKSVEFDTKGLSEKNRKLLSEITQTQLQF
jgi:mRNA-degrading endonuclease RelE of RelBE toxin-antitoxin system